MSKARNTLGKNLRDLELLLKIHEQITGLGPGRRGAEANVLNRGAIVLGCAAWEAYVEDVCTEAMAFLVKKARCETTVPDGVKYLVVQMLKQDKASNETRYWKLADSGWRKNAIAQAVKSSTARFHNPTCAKTDQLLAKCLGLKDLRALWGREARRLDKFVNLRHEVAHGEKAKVVQKKQVQDLRALLAKLGDRLDDHIATHVEALLKKDRTEAAKARLKRPGPKPKKPATKRGRPPKLRPW